MIELNYRSKINDIEKVLVRYQKYDLSLIGKVTVIKTIAIPKLVYLLTVLPSPRNVIYDSINGMFSKFLWGEKVRIAVAQLEKNIEDGGLKLTNLRLFQIALKLSWIKRLIESHGVWQSVFDIHFKINKKIFWELDGKSLRKLAHRIPNSFWSDVILAWVNYKTKTNLIIRS